MAITIVTRAGKGSPLNATEHDDNLLNIVAGIENTSTGHDHDGTDSKKVIAGNVTNTPAGNIAATDVQSALNELDTEKLAKASNLSDVANAATAFGNIKQSATTSATGVSELATTDETITGTDTARTTTPASVAGAMAVQTNPLAKSQGVHMTYVASGSSGIAVADNADIDFGTGNFTVSWRGTLPDWDSATEQRLINKYGASSIGWQFYITSGTMSMYLRNAGTSIIKNSSSALTLTDNTEHELTCVVVRETASVAGSITFYVDGKVFGSAQTITAASPVDISNAYPLYVMGSNAVRNESIIKSAITYNRALTASEVLDLYRHGIAFADKWGSQTNKLTGTNSDMSGANSWMQSGLATFDINSTVAGKMYMLGNGSSDLAYITNTLQTGKKYRIILKARLNAGSSTTIYCGNWTVAAAGVTAGTAFALTPIGTEATYSGEITSFSTTLYLGVEGTGFNGVAFEIDDVEIYQLGATLALEPEGIQQGRWLDSSSNALNATWPTSGASLIRPISNQPVLTNLLTNSGFGVWSNSGLTQGRTVARQTDYEVGSAIYTNDGTGDTGWALARATVASAGGELVLTDDGTNTDMYMYRALSGLTVGKLYKYSVKLTNGTGTWASGKVSIHPNAFTAAIASANTQTEASQQDYSVIWEATETNNIIAFFGVPGGAGNNLKIDTIDVYEVTPGCVGADAKAMDGWQKSATLDLYREFSGVNTVNGSFFGVKAVSGAANDVLYWAGALASNANFIANFAGRTITIGMWVIASDANHVRLRIYDTVGGAVYSSYHTGSGLKEWLEVTATIDSAPTEIYPFSIMNTISGKTAYFSQPMLVFGSSIGEGNYQPIQNEVVDLEAYVRIDPGTVTSTTLFNLEAKTNGKLPKGLKAIYSSIVGKNTAANKIFGMYGTVPVYSSTFQNTQVANQDIYLSGRTLCDANGDVTLYVADGNFTLQNWDIHSVQVN
jgi:hypothetical protein